MVTCYEFTARSVMKSKMAALAEAIDTSVWIQCTCANRIGKLSCAQCELNSVVGLPIATAVSSPTSSLNGWQVGQA